MKKEDFMQKWVELAQKEHPDATHVAIDSDGGVLAYFPPKKRTYSFSANYQIGIDDENAHLWKTSLRQIPTAEPKKDAEPDFMQPWVKLAKEEHPYAKHVAMDEGGNVWVYEGATKGVCTFEVIGFDKENAHKWRDSLRYL